MLRRQLADKGSSMVCASNQLFNSQLLQLPENYLARANSDSPRRKCIALRIGLLVLVLVLVFNNQQTILSALKLVLPILFLPDSHFVSIAQVRCQFPSILVRVLFQLAQSGRMRNFRGNQWPEDEIRFLGLTYSCAMYIYRASFSQTTPTCSTILQLNQILARIRLQIVVENLRNLPHNHYK